MPTIRTPETRKRPPRPGEGGTRTGRPTCHVRVYPADADWVAAETARYNLPAAEIVARLIADRCKTE